MGRRLLLLTEDVVELRLELSELQVGDHFTFGNYHGPIEWRVLDKTSDSLLVISEFALDAKPFDEEGKTNDWYSCSLKEWLNSEFFNKAFNSEEKSVISDNPYGNVFCLNIIEAKKYFSSDSDRKCKPTSYALSQEVSTHQGYCRWWLRSRNNNIYFAESVGRVGSAYDRGNKVSAAVIPVRPAMKLRI